MVAEGEAGGAGAAGDGPAGFFSDPCGEHAGGEGVTGTVGDGDFADGWQESEGSGSVEAGGEGHAEREDPSPREVVDGEAAIGFVP